MQYEGEVKSLKDFLTGVRGSIAMVTKGDASYSDDSWMKLREVCIHILNCVTLKLSIKRKKSGQANASHFPGISANLFS